MPVAHRLWQSIRRQPVAFAALFVALGGTSYAATTTATTSATASGGATRDVRVRRARARDARPDDEGRALPGRPAQGLVGGRATAARTPAAGRRGPAGRRGRRRDAGDGADRRGRGRGRSRRARAGQGAPVPQGLPERRGRPARLGRRVPSAPPTRRRSTRSTPASTTLEAANARLATQVGDLAGSTTPRLAAHGRVAGRGLAKQVAITAMTADRSPSTAVETRFAGVTRNGDTLRFSGLNLQLVNGAGRTDSANGRGNLIVGYNESPGAQTGSHVVAIGRQHRFTSWAGLVAGQNNTIGGDYAVGARRRRQRRDGARHDRRRRHREHGQRPLRGGARRQRQHRERRPRDRRRRRLQRRQRGRDVRRRRWRQHRQRRDGRGHGGHRQHRLRPGHGDQRRHRRRRLRRGGVGQRRARQRRAGHLHVGARRPRRQDLAVPYETFPTWW